MLVVVVRSFLKPAARCGAASTWIPSQESGELVCADRLDAVDLHQASTPTLFIDLLSAAGASLPHEPRSRICMLAENTDSVTE